MHFHVIAQPPRSRYHCFLPWAYSNDSICCEHSRWEFMLPSRVAVNVGARWLIVAPSERSALRNVPRAMRRYTGRCGCSSAHRSPPEKKQLTIHTGRHDHFKTSARLSYEECKISWPSIFYSIIHPSIVAFVFPIVISGLRICVDSTHLSQRYRIFPDRIPVLKIPCARDERGRNS